MISRKCQYQSNELHLFKIRYDTIPKAFFRWNGFLKVLCYAVMGNQQRLQEVINGHAAAGATRKEESRLRRFMQGFIEWSRKMTPRGVTGFRSCDDPRVRGVFLYELIETNGVAFSYQRRHNAGYGIARIKGVVIANSFRQSMSNEILKVAIVSLEIKGFYISTGNQALKCASST